MMRGVIGSGDAKISASRTAFNSAVARFVGASSAAACSVGTRGVSASPPGDLSFSATMCLRVADRVRRIRGPRALVDADRAKPGTLEHSNQLQPNHFQERQEGHDQTRPVADVAEKLFEAARFGFRQARQQLIDALLER